VNLPADAVVILVALDADGRSELRIASNLPITPYIIEWAPPATGPGDETHHCYVKTGYGEAGITTPIPDKIDQMNDADTQAVAGFYLSEQDFERVYGVKQEG
jgi:hypothetical protein